MAPLTHNTANVFEIYRNSQEAVRTHFWTILIGGQGFQMDVLIFSLLVYMAYKLIRLVERTFCFTEIICSCFECLLFGGVGERTVNMPVPTDGSREPTTRPMADCSGQVRVFNVYIQSKLL